MIWVRIPVGSQISVDYQLINAFFVVVYVSFLGKEHKKTTRCQVVFNTSTQESKTKNETLLKQFIQRYRMIVPCWPLKILL